MTRHQKFKAHHTDYKQLRNYILGLISVHLKMRDLYHHHTQNKQPGGVTHRASTVEMRLLLLSNEERRLSQKVNQLCY